MREIKFVAVYQSPYTDEPNKLLVSEPVLLEDVVGCNAQIDFTDGSYLMLDEMEACYTKWLRYTGFKDRHEREIYEGCFIGILNKGCYCVRGRVEFKRGSFRLRWIDKKVRQVRGEKHSEVMPANLGRVGSPWEIIDNIEENPELLEDQGQ